MQAKEAVSFRSAKYMSQYIKEQWQLAAQSVRHSSSGKVMEAYYNCMDQMCCCSKKQLNSRHISAIVNGTAKAWVAAETRHSGLAGEQQAEQNLRDFIARMLQRLEPLLPAVSARAAASLLWSSAKLGLNPNALVPGMTDSLAREFMADIDAATGQELASVLVACAKLQLSPCQGGLFKAVLNRLATADLSEFKPQNVANALHSLARLPAAAPSVEVLDALCKRFSALLNSRQTCELPDAQNIANTLWALSKLKHAPSDELAMSMVGRMVALCQGRARAGQGRAGPGQQPAPQAISNVLLACAELRLPVKQADTDSLVSFLLSLDRQHTGKQGYANTAWGLSVLGHLRVAQLERLLDQLATLLDDYRELSQPSLLNVADLKQLYQALDWLQPPENADIQQGKAWQSLKEKLGALGPQPACNTEPHPRAQLVCSALTQLGVRFKATPVISGYRTAAVLEPIGSAPLIVVSFELKLCLNNQPSR